MKMIQKELVNFFINSIFFLTFVQVCVPYFNYAIYLFLVIVSCMGIVYLIKRGKAEKHFLLLLILFFLPVLLSSTIGLSFSLIYEERVDYSQLSVLGRISNLVLIFIVMVFISTYSYQQEYNCNNYLSQAKYYWFGCFILLLTAAWHLLSIHTNLITFPFETRSNVHGSLNVYSFSRRITGIAEEPSYLSPFIIDFFIFTILICRKKIMKYSFLLFSLIILVFTFSPAGYFSFFFAFMFALLAIFKFKFNAKKLPIYLLILIFSIGCVYFVMDYLYNLEYIIDRLNSVNDSARFETIYKTLGLTINSNFMSLLFGHGIKSFSLIQQIVIFNSGDSFFITSNNLFVDSIWETGIIGTLIYLIGFFAVFSMIRSSDVTRLQKFVLWFIFFNWCFTSLYRADYANLHFFILLYFLFVISKIKFDV